MKIAVFILGVVLPSLYVCTPCQDNSAAAGANSGAQVQSTGKGTDITAHTDANAEVNLKNPLPSTGTPTSSPTGTPTSTPTATPTSSPTGTPTSSPTTTPTPTLPSPSPPFTATPPAEDGSKLTGHANSNTNANIKQGGPGGAVDVKASSGADVSVGISGNKYDKCDIEGFDKHAVLVKNQGDLQKMAKSWMVWKSFSSAKVDIQEKLCLPRYMAADGCHSSMLKISVQSETEILYEAWGRNQEKVIYTKQKMSISSEKFHVYTTNVLTVTELQNGSQEVVTVKNEQSIRQIFDNNSLAVVDSDLETYMVVTTKGENGSTFIAVSEQVYQNVEMKQQVSQKVDQVLQTNNFSSITFVEVQNQFDLDVNQYQWDKSSQGGGSNGSGGTDVTVKANSAVDVNLKNTGNTGKPDVQGFTNYSVLKVSFEEFMSKIDKITWHLSKYTPSSEEVKTDVTVCADRYIQNSSSCTAVKFQYVTENGEFVVKEWGLAENLIYIQAKLTASSQEYIVLKAEVDNVMKATRDSNVAVSVSDDSQVKTYLGTDYAIIGTDFTNYIMGQTSYEKGAITFIAFTEDIYLCEESQQKFAEQISQILKVNGIDESKLVKLTQKFDVDTNKYNQNNAPPGNNSPPSTSPAATPAVPPTAPATSPPAAGNPSLGVSANSGANAQIGYS